MRLEQLDTLLTVSDVAEILCIGVRTVWRWAALGKIPKPVRLSRKTLRWKASQLQAYLDGASWERGNERAAHEQVSQTTTKL
jgi:excisionase family DNA binding protein